jgi:hypothetical protein
MPVAKRRKITPEPEVKRDKGKGKARTGKGARLQGKLASLMEMPMDIFTEVMFPKARP